MISIISLWVSVHLLLLLFVVVWWCCCCKCCVWHRRRRRRVVGRHQIMKGLVHYLCLYLVGPSSSTIPTSWSNTNKIIISSCWGVTVPAAAAAAVMWLVEGIHQRNYIEIETLTNHSSSSSRHLVGGMMNLLIPPTMKLSLMVATRSFLFSKKSSNLYVFLFSSSFLLASLLFSPFLHLLFPFFLGFLVLQICFVISLLSHSSHVLPTYLFHVYHIVGRR